MSNFRISVLIPTYNRAPLLKEVLNSLEKQSLPKDQYEVIVIDDGSSDNTAKAVSNFCEKFSIRYAYQENQGISVAKNHAIQLSQAPIVLFMDDDDIADSHLLVEHLNSHEAYPEENMAVLGFTSLDEDVSASPLMHFVTQVGYYLFNYPIIKHGDMLNYTYFWGGRSSCKKTLLLRCGMFDPVFRFGTEDIELGYRLSACDLKVVYNQNAYTTMIRTMSLNDFCKRVEQQGYSNWIFSQKHPVSEVELWTDVLDINTRWRVIKHQLEIIRKSAFDLEKIVQMRQKYEMKIDDSLTSLLHNAYWKVFDSYRIKGSWKAQQDQIQTRVTQVSGSNSMLDVIADQNKYAVVDFSKLLSRKDIGNQFEILLSIIYRALVKEGDAIVDGGANGGLHAIPLAHIVGEKGVVYAYEPQGELLEKLKVWARIDHVTKNITSREVALSNLQENVEFWINTANNALSSIVRPPTEKNNNWYPEMVMAVKLDDEKLRHPISFIKLDIEGYEFRALQGAKKILDGDKPIIVFENSREQAAILCDYIAEDFFRFFINTGYSLYDFWGQPFTLSNWESDDVPWYFIAIHSLDNRTGYLLNIIKQFWGKLDLNIYLDDWNTVVSIISNKRGTY